MNNTRRQRLLCMKKQIILATLIFFALSSHSLKAQEAGQKQKDFSATLKEEAASYIAKDNYDGFYQYLEALLKKGYAKSPDVYFYLAWTRCNQILYWQNTKNWENVYDKAPFFKKEIAENLDKAQQYSKGDLTVLLDIKYLRWQNTKDDDPEQSVELFNDLVNTATELSQTAASIEKVKDIADELVKLEDKNLSRRLYEIYVLKLSKANLSEEELKTTGEKFLSEDNVYLAKSVFDIYLNQLSGNTDEMAKETVAVANKFAHQDKKDGIDPFYAETLYKKAYDLSGRKAFDSSSQYRRAFNLERLKEYEPALNEYKSLLDAYADYAPKANILFRVGVLTAYAAKNISAAEEYFVQVRDEFPDSLATLSSLYQSGLLNQWDKKDDKAKEYYNAFLEAAKTRGIDLEENELALLAQERLEEIDEKKEIKYALKLFLEGTFSGVDLISKSAPETTTVIGVISVDLTGRPAKENINKPVAYVVTTSNPETGCMTPLYAYEWSGEVGKISNIPNSPELTTEYASPGIKVIHVAVVGPQGPEGVAFEMIEIED